METVNEQLLRHSVDHAIDLQHLGNSVSRKMLSLLNKSDARLTIALQSALERLPVESFTVQRLDALLSDVRALNGAAYQSVRKGLESDLLDLTVEESAYNADLFKHVLPVSVSVATVSPQMVYAAAMARPFQVSKDRAVPLLDYLDGLGEDRARMIRDSIRLGYINGETNDQIVRTIRGTKTQNYADGLMQAPRQYIENMVRTAINHTSNFTAQRFYEANGSMIKGVMWVATLDSRTSLVCASRDGKVYPLDSGPRPPAHIGCRSRTSPVVKSWRELGLNIDEFKSTRASIDGQVPEDLTYQKWLEKQTATRQDEILGTTKGRLFRAGGTLDKFVDNKGRTLTIDQLRQKHTELFSRAGI